MIKFEMRVKDVPTKLHILRSNFYHVWSINGAAEDSPSEICNTEETLRKDHFLANFDKIFGSEIIEISDDSSYDILVNNIFHFLDFSAKNEISFADVCILSHVILIAAEYCLGLLNLSASSEKEKLSCLYDIFTLGRHKMTGSDCKSLFQYLYSTYDKTGTEWASAFLRTSSLQWFEGSGR